ncbi:MAG: potassium channel family protein [Bacteroidota bacterium]
MKDKDKVQDEANIKETIPKKSLRERFAEIRARATKKISWIPLKDLRVRLTKVSSLQYMIIYLITIPVFAGIFSLIPHHFYHSTAVHEPYFENGLDELKYLINEDFKSDIRTKSGAKSRLTIESDLLNELNARIRGIRSGSIELFIEDIECNNVTIHETYVSAELFYWFKLNFLEPDSMGRRIHYGRPFNLNWEVRKDRLNNNITRFYSTSEIAYNNEFDHHLFNLVFKRDPESKKYFPFEISKTTEELMETLFHAGKGFPHNTIGTYPRMLYMSATTLTTLGLGDVTPVTNTSRLLVVLESMLGIILMGLFVNSLATEVVERSQSPVKEDQES